MPLDTLGRMESGIHGNSISNYAMDNDMKTSQIIEQLRSIEPTTNLQREAIAWCVGIVLHRQQEIDRGTQEQKRTETVSSTTHGPVSGGSDGDRFHAQIKAAGRAVKAAKAEEEGS